MKTIIGSLGVQDCMRLRAALERERERERGKGRGREGKGGKGRERKGEQSRAIYVNIASPIASSIATRWASWAWTRDALRRIKKR